jgi:hypothetical protein
MGKAAARIEIPFVISVPPGLVMYALVAMRGAGGAVMKRVSAVAVILWAESIDAMQRGRVIVRTRKVKGGALTGIVTSVVPVVTVGMAVRRRGMKLAVARKVRFLAP